MERTRQALAAEGLDEPLPQRGFPDVHEVLERTRKGGLASGLELRHVADLLAAASELRSYAKAHRAKRELLCDAIDSAATLDQLRDALARALDSDGTVLDSASPELGRARRAAAEQRRVVQRQLQGMLSKYRDSLRDDFYTERDGRYVLPVRSDSHLKVEGIVLGSSASGGTLYVEPLELTGLGNQLQISEAAVEREEAKVLAELCSQVLQVGAEVSQAWEACVIADELGAITRWAKLSRASAVQLSSTTTLRLLGVRHPLLAHMGSRVVPNDVQLAGGTALVLSGPNAGGKTVLLKCIGLAIWMAHAGLPIPAEPESVVGWFDIVLSDMGDNQSIDMSLSTFSAHVGSLAGIVQAAGTSTLALLDEVAAGTDPEEGSALAAAILEDLVAKGAAVLVTTHYDRLKELAARNPAFENGSVGFDLETLSPTFKLAVGAPGPSTALIVAQRFGIPEPIVARAKELLPVDSLDREKLVRELEAERQKLERARLTAEADARRQEQLRLELEQERKTVREKERSKLERSGAELASEIQEARMLVRDARARLRAESLREAELRQLERAIDEAARPIVIGGRVQQTLRNIDDPLSRPIHSAELVPGLTVSLPKLGTTGKILDVSDKGQLTVQVGALKLRASPEDVILGKATPTSGTRPPAPPKKRQRAEAMPQATTLDTIRTSANTLDLRGQRVEEALDEVDRFLDVLLQRGEPSGFVLHGHGTGALKAAVRAHLAAHPLVTRARPAERDEGGDAFSVFWLGGPVR